MTPFQSFEKSGNRDRAALSICQGFTFPSYGKPQNQTTLFQKINHFSGKKDACLMRVFLQKMPDRTFDRSGIDLFFFVCLFRKERLAAQHGRANQPGIIAQSGPDNGGSNTRIEASRMDQSLQRLQQQSVRGVADASAQTDDLGLEDVD